MIVADTGVQAENSGGAFAVFGGLPRWFDFNGAECVGADPGQDLTVRRLSNVEAIEQS